MAVNAHIQHVRGDNAKNNAYTGNAGEITINTDSNSLRIHDGVTSGGHGTIYSMHVAIEEAVNMADLAEGAVVYIGTEAPYVVKQNVNGALVQRDVRGTVELSSEDGNIITSEADGLYATINVKSLISSSAGNQITYKNKGLFVSKKTAWDYLSSQDGNKISVSDEDGNLYVNFVHEGTTEPAASLGEDGDFYIQLS